MITKWKLFNFKSIREQTELELGPLTIFAGANSSGKSTFIQSVLLVAQTLAHKVGSRSVVLNGALTSLGQFDDLRSNGGSSDQITIKCTCRPRRDHDVAILRRNHPGSRSGIKFYGPRPNFLQEITCEISFDADGSNTQSDMFQIQPRLSATQLSCISRDEDNVDQKAEISIQYSNNEISQIEETESVSKIDDQLRSGLAYDISLDSDSLDDVNDEYRSAKPIGCILRHFLPERIVCVIDPIEEDANKITAALRGEYRRAFALRHRLRKDTLLSEEIIAVLRDVLKGKYRENSGLGLEVGAMTFGSWHEWLRSLPADDRVMIQRTLLDSEDLFDRIYCAMTASKENDAESKFVYTRLPRLIAQATRDLDNFFASSLKYLGPLRDTPKPLYSLAPAADPHDVGLRGEHTAFVLELHKDKNIRYIPSANFQDPVVDHETATATLEVAVIDWLQYMGVASSVESRYQGRLGHELKVGLVNADSTHHLTHVGVGVSQVLPILVMCLLAGTDSTLVFEQPELHLHPKVQTLLGDFFLSMALCDKQCIVETHSEYFVDRLRFRIAAATSDKELNSQTKIYFVEKLSQGSVFREVLINEYGAITDWPEGFFDQSQRQAEDILRAATMKRKARRSNLGA